MLQKPSYMRSLITLFICIIYCWWMSFYLNDFTTRVMSYEKSKAVTGFLFFFVLVYTWLWEKYNYGSYDNKVWNYLLRGLISITFLIFGLHYLHMLNDTYTEYRVFLALSFFYLICLLFDYTNTKWFKKGKVA